jgi:hypothetical protein
MSGENAMKTAMVMALMPMLLAATAYAAGAGFGDVDIVGSKLSNIQIISPHAGSGDFENKLDIVGSNLDKIQIFSDNADLGNTEIVGSTVTNVKISPLPKPEKKCMREKSRCDDVKCYWDSACVDNPHCKPSVTCPKPHLGVDAWYGRYWFNDQMYTPKWPQMY